MLFGFDKPQKTNSSSATTELIKDSTTTEFVKDVVEGSMVQPVLVDFWAPWCGPCKQLAPILEAAVTAAAGKVKLVKLDIDQYPEIPGQLGIQSIPTVYAFAQGRPVNVISGAQNESHIKAFIDKLIQGYSQEAKDVASLMAEAEDFFMAEAIEDALQNYQKVLSEEPGHTGALSGFGLCLLKQNQSEEAQALLDSLDDEAHKDPAIIRLATAIAMAHKMAKVKSIELLHKALALNANDHDSRFELALALASSGQNDLAVDALIEIIKQDRDWNEGQARFQLFDFFEIWGAKHPATLSGRRKLSSVMFR